MRWLAPFITLAIFLSPAGCKKDVPMAAEERGDRVRAPELSSGTAWLNTRQPLTLAQLRGKFVLLDFWTYG